MRQAHQRSRAADLCREEDRRPEDSAAAGAVQAAVGLAASVHQVGRQQHAAVHAELRPRRPALAHRPAVTTVSELPSENPPRPHRGRGDLFPDMYDDRDMTSYKVTSKVVLWPGTQGAWHFAYVDKATAEKIRKKFGPSGRGFGSIRVRVKLGKTAWDTSIFPDKRSGTYLLPLKAKVRRDEGVDAGDMITIKLEIV